MAYYIILGPTASGKTTKAVALARSVNGEIISADSRQVYRGMDIGTGKDLDEYGDVPYHLIDIHPAGYHYNLYEFLRDERTCRNDVISRGKVPVMCGGTGLYIESAVKGQILPEVPANEELRNSLRGKSIDELTAILASMKTLHNVTDVDTCQRAIRAIEIQTYYKENPKIAQLVNNPQPIKDCVIIGLDIDRDNRRRRISDRLRSRVDEGLFEEVESLLDDGVDPQTLINYGLEYKFITLYHLGQVQSKDEVIRQLEIAIHQFAKRQMTWFRGMVRRGFKIHWLPYNMANDEFCDKVMSL